MLNINKTVQERFVTEFDVFLSILRYFKLCITLVLFSILHKFDIKNWTKGGQGSTQVGFTFNSFIYHTLSLHAAEKTVSVSVAVLHFSVYKIVHSLLTFSCFSFHIRRFQIFKIVKL